MGQITVTFSTAGPHSFPVPNGVATADSIEGWGGGGDGAPGSSGGGAGGGYARLDNYSWTPSDVLECTVGTATINSKVVDNNGGGTEILRALGNASGSGTSGGVAAGGGIGDVTHAGASGGNGDVTNATGGGGGSSAGTAADGVNGTNGDGVNGGAGGVAPSGGGDGGRGGDVVFGDGVPGVQPGGGGGGGSAVNASGAGALGQIVIKYTVSDVPAPRPLVISQAVKAASYY